jgi:hypothetical protein
MKTRLKKLFLTGIIFVVVHFIKADQKITLINFTDTAYALVKQPGGNSNLITKVKPFQLNTTSIDSKPVFDLFVTPHAIITDKLKQNRSLQIMGNKNQPVILAIETTKNGTTILSQLNQTSEQNSIVINNKTDEQLLLRLEIPDTNIWEATDLGFGQKEVTKSEYPTFLYYIIPQKQMVTITRPDLKVNTQETVKNAQLQNLQCMLKIVTPENLPSGITQSFGFQENNSVEFNQNITTEFDQIKRNSMVQTNNIKVKKKDGKEANKAVTFSLKPKETDGVAAFIVDYEIKGNINSSYNFNKKYIKVEKINLK